MDNFSLSSKIPVLPVSVAVAALILGGAILRRRRDKSCEDKKICDSAETSCPSPVIVHVPEHEKYLTSAGAISSVTLVHGWTDEVTAKLKRVLQRIAEENPLLTSALRKSADGSDFYFESGVHSDLLLAVNGPSDFVSPPAIGKAIPAVQKEIEPLFEQYSIGDGVRQLESGGPVFRVIVMKLAEDLVAYAVEMSHSLGDGNTYYETINLMNCGMNDLPLPQLEWKVAEECVVVPSVYTPEDKAVALQEWLPAFIEKCNIYGAGKPGARVTTTRLVDPANLKALKARYMPLAQSQGVEFLSSNDIITAAFCDVAEEGSICWMAVSMRGRMPEASKRAAGNYQRMVHFPTAIGADPVFIRKLGENSWAYFGLEGNERISEGVGKAGMVAAKGFIVTNWASLTYMISPPNAKVVCHVPASKFINNIPGLDCTIVFKADADGTLAVITNIMEGQRGRESEENIKRSELFNSVFKST